MDDIKACVKEAIEKGNLSELHRLLEDFPEWDITLEHLKLSHYTGSGGKQTALHLACMCGHLNIVEHLVLGRGCSVTQTNLGGLTPLELAWYYKQWEVVLCLLNYIQEKGLFQGKSPSQSVFRSLSTEAIIPRFLELAPFEENSLRAACKQNLLQTLKCLCKMKRNSPGLHTSWRVACASRDLHTMQFIIKYGNFIDHEMPNLHKACLLGDETMAIKMINESQSGINSLVETDKYGMTPVHYASCEPHLLHILVRVGEQMCDDIGINMELFRDTAMRNTPLHYAVMCGCLESLDILASICGPLIINLKNNTGCTPLHLSVKQLNMLVALLKYQQCNINNTNNNGETALHIACRGWNVECVRALIKSERCDPNIQLRDGSTALHVAVRSTYTVYQQQIVQCLVERTTIDPNCKDNSGQTPLHISVERKHLESSSSIIKHSNVRPNIQNSDGNTVLHLGVGSLSAVELFLSHTSIDLNIQNSAGNTPLHEAVIRGVSCNVVKALVLHKSCDLNIINKAGMTPLKCSITSGELDYVEVLISSGKCSISGIHRDVDSNKLLVSELLNCPDFSINKRDRNGETALHKACIGGNLENIRVLIGDERCDPNIQLSDGRTALHVAVNRHFAKYQHEAVQCLLKSTKINLNLKDNSGQTPLHIAVVRKHFNTASLLLEYSTCKPNLQDNDGNTALHLSVGSLSAVELFLSHTNIDLNIQNSAGNTPLHEAVIKKMSCDIVKALVLHKSCDPNIVNMAGMTLLQCAIASRELDYVEVLISSDKCSLEHNNIIVKSISHNLLLHRVVDSKKAQLLSALLKFQRCSINDKDSDGETALHKACRSGNLECFLVLIRDKQCDPNIQLSDGSTALHVAVSSHYTVYKQEIVRCLLENTKIDPNVKDNSGQTPLHIAVIRRHFEAVSLLLKHSKHKPNLQDNNGNTALHLGVGSLFVVRLFLSHASIDINIQNSAGNTPLHEAVIRGSSCDVVKALVLHKSYDPNIVNMAGMTLLQCAIASRELDYVEVLISSDKYSLEHSNIIVKSISHNLLLHRVVDSKKAQLLSALLKFQRCSINDKDSDGETALHKACRSGNLECFLALIKDGRCDPNIELSDGSTALHVAVSSHYTVYKQEIVRCLLENTKIDPNVKDNSGQTPLHIAVIRRHFETVSLLLKHSKHKHNLQDNNGNTALHLGVGSLFVVRLFLSHASIDINIQNSAGNTPLHEAVIRGASSNIVKALVHHKSCDPNIVNTARIIPLQCAIIFGKLDYVEILISSGKCMHEHKTISGTHRVVNKLRLFSALLQCPDLSINERDDNGETALHKACRGMKLGYIRALIGDERCDPNIQLSDGSTALHVAVSSNYHRVYQHEAVQCLLQSTKIDPNLKDNSGQTPLHIAVVRKHLETIFVVKSFLGHASTDVNIQNSAGNTPLHEAVIRGSSCDVVKALVLHKSYDPNIVNMAGMTLLQCAIASRELDYVEVLISSDKYSLEHNNIIVKSISHNLLLHRVVDSKKAQLLSALLKFQRCSINDKDSDGETALHKACRSGNLECFLALIKDGRCDPNIELSDGSTALHVAVSSHYTVYKQEIVRCLLENTKIDPNVKDNSGQTPLHIAVVRRHFETVSLLLKHSKYKPNLQDNNGNTALHLGVGSLFVVRLFLSHASIDINIQNSAGNTPLHEAVIRGASSNIVKALVHHKDCDVLIRDKNGKTHLQLTMFYVSRLDIMEALLASDKLGLQDTIEGLREKMWVFSKGLLHNYPILVKKCIEVGCSINNSNAIGETPLHIVCREGHKESCLVLLQCKEINVLAQDLFGNAPIHIVCLYLKEKCLEILLDHEICEPNLTNHEGDTPLHILCSSQHTSEKMVSMLLSIPEVDHKCVNHREESCLVRLQCKKINILAQDQRGDAPIHIACQHLNEKCLEMLLNHKMCDPNQTNHEGDTPLHILCSSQQPSENMISMLISHPGINLKCINYFGQTPLDCVPKYNTSRFNMISKCIRLKQIKLETYLKIFVLGNSGNGKSTLIKAITTETSQLLKFAARRVNPSDVPPHTAGIVPIPFNSKYFGHAVLYDFAGQHEYYSSHAAVIENLILPSPPLFLLLIDISKPIEKIKEELMYWWLYIDNHCQRAIRIPHAILVGSHKDIARLNGEDPQRKMKDITESIMNKEVSFTLEGYFLLDCRRLASKGLTGLLNQLRTTCQTLRETADIDLHCNILKAICVEEFDDETVACKFSDIVDMIKSEQLLPQIPSRLILLLSTLSDKGHILLLQNHTDVNKSWVILKPSVLLTKVNGSIFAPEKFKDQEQSSHKCTGVVTLTNIKEKFSNVSHQVITGYLTHMEYCFQIKDQHTLELITNDPALKVDSEEEEVYYFFPGLVQTENPKDVYQPQDGIAYFECGWLCKCYNESEQLTTRFLHVLIFRLAFSCQPPNDPTVRESVVLLRSCSVWKHGIAWWTNDGIETIVEVDVQCRWVAVMMRCPDTHKVQCAELRSKVIATVLKTMKNFCPAITMNEFLIPPSSLRYPFQGRELTLYSMREISNVVIDGMDFATDIEGKNPFRLSLLLPFEPYFSMGSTTMHEFFSTDQSRLSRELALEELFRALTPNLSACEDQWAGAGDSRVRTCVALFHNLQRRGCKTWRDFEREFSRVSIFCGRNPLDLCGRQFESLSQLDTHIAGFGSEPEPEPEAYLSSMITVIRKHISILTDTISLDLIHFSNQFIENGFITQTASRNIFTKHGIGAADKASQLLNLISSNYEIALDKEEWTERFIATFSSQEAYKDLAATLRREIHPSGAES